jgi:predicted outer membrane repeat protein
MQVTNPSSSPCNRPPQRMIALFLGAAALAAAAAMPVAQANTITVNDLVDGTGGPNCKLRDAITAANNNTAVGGCAAGSPGLDTIVFSLSIACNVVQCSSLLSSALPTVTQDLTINGGSAHPSISGENLYRVFDLGVATVNISNLIITKGSGDFGGGMRMAGTTLTLNNVNFPANHAQFLSGGGGGGIYVESGTLTVNNSTFPGNSAGGFGGAIGQAGGSVTVNGGSFTNNTAGSGGAIGTIATSGLNIAGSVFDTNGAALWGGAVYVQDSTAQATIAGTTFTNNYAQGVGPSFGGGAIRVSNGKLRLTASTLTGNTAVGNGAALNLFGIIGVLSNVTLSGNVAQGSGGGIYAQTDNPFSSPLMLDIDNATITGNTADTDNNDVGNGGGIFVLSGTANVRNSIIAGNFDTPNNSGAGTVHPNCSGTFATTQFNLIGRNDGCSGFVNGVNGNQVGTAAAPIDPKLDPSGLQNNGGPTKTIALLPGSPAIDKGKNTATDALGNPILTDQRGTGFVRTIDFPALANASGGDGTDIGAFEFTPTATLDIDASVSATRYDALTDGLLVIRYLFGLSGPGLTAGALGGTATRTDPAAIVTYLDGVRTALDIDGNGATDALTDGLLILRYMFGLRGSSLITGAFDPLGTRKTSQDIETYIQLLMP